MRKQVLVAAVFAAAVLLACSLSSVINAAQKAKSVAPTAQALASQLAPTVQAAITQVGPTVQGAQAATPGASGGQGSAGAANWRSPEDSATLHSFHQEMVVRVKIGSAAAYDLFKMEEDDVRGQASRQKITQKDGSTIEIVSVGGKTWYQVEGKWLAIADPHAVHNPQPLVTGALGPELADASHWKANGTGTLDGMKVYRYTYEAPQGLVSAEQGWLALLQAVPQLVGATRARVTRVRGEISVLQDGTMVRAFYRVAGEVEKGGQQVPVEVTVTTALSNLNGNIQITPPPVAAGAKPPVPLPPGATQEMQMGASSIYTVADMTVAQVMQFFDQAFAQQGYKVMNKVGSDQSGWTLRVIDPQGKEHLLMVASESGKVSITIVK